MPPAIRLERRRGRDRGDHPRRRRGAASAGAAAVSDRRSRRASHEREAVPERLTSPRQQRFSRLVAETEAPRDLVDGEILDVTPFERVAVASRKMIERDVDE